MIMTDEQKRIDDIFQNFLNEIDKTYFACFNSEEIGINSVKNCFATLNGDKLRFSSKTNLRQDIFEIVVAKHKELWSDLHDFKVIE